MSNVINVTEEGRVTLVVEPAPVMQVVVEPKVTEIVPVETPGTVVVTSNLPGPRGVVVSDQDPMMTTPGLWIQTGLGPTGEDFTFWIEDGR